jgi:hypothetical protein
MVTEANLLISSCTHFTHQRDSHKDGRGWSNWTPGSTWTCMPWNI